MVLKTDEEYQHLEKVHIFYGLMQNEGKDTHLKLVKGREGFLTPRQRGW
jgi:hypothetical protein